MIVILNKRPLRVTPYYAWLHEAGEDIVLITAMSNQTEDDLEEARKHYRQVLVFKDYDANGYIDKLILEFHVRETVSALIALSEVDIIRVARLRQKLGLHGQHLGSALAYRDKFVMKSLLDDVPIAACAPVDHAFDLIEYVATHSFPLVVKPRRLSGSMGLTILADQQAFDTFLRSGFDTAFDAEAGMMVESFVDGEMYHIDGLILAGTLQFIWPSRYVNGCLAFLDSAPLGSTMVAPDDPLCPRLRSFVSRVIEQLPNPVDCAFHAEVFHTPDDRLVFCEIACRAGGAAVNSALKYAFSIDMNRYAVMGQAGLQPTLTEDAEHPGQLAGWLLYPPTDKTLTSIPTSCPFDFVKESIFSCTPGSRLRQAIHSVDKIAMFTFVGRDESELDHNCRTLSDWFESQCIWVD